MIRSLILLVSCLTIFVQPIAMAAANYNDSLKAGDDAMNAGNLDLAMQEFEAAIGHAVAEGEKSFAKAKKAYVLAFRKKDYAAARKELEGVVSINTLSPVAQLTVLQVLAECQMRGDRNFLEAAVNLEKAAALPNVDFARPYVRLALADCYRETGDFPKALDTCRAVLETAGISPQTQASAHFNMGMTYQYGMKDVENAKKAYAEAVKLNPGLKGEVDSHSSKMP